MPLLFGYSIEDEIELLRHNMRDPPGPVAQRWVMEVHAGNFDAVPDDLRWDSSVHLAHLIDGYALAEELGLGNPFEFEARQLAHATEAGRWAGGPATLWTTLFLEHRRWRASAPCEPDRKARALLDRLCGQLAASLNRASRTTP